jgi:predicted nucleic acid-binding Zn ribbon protein
MNCCDEYGNCRQGRDCPVRREMLNDQRQRKRADFVGTLLFLTAICCIVAIVVLFARSG